MAGGSTACAQQGLSKQSFESESNPGMTRVSPCLCQGLWAPPQLTDTLPPPNAAGCPWGLGQGLTSLTCGCVPGDAPSALSS